MIGRGNSVQLLFVVRFLLFLLCLEFSLLFLEGLLGLLLECLLLSLELLGLLGVLLLLFVGGSWGSLRLLGFFVTGYGGWFLTKMDGLGLGDQADESEQNKLLHF